MELRDILGCAFMFIMMGGGAFWIYKIIRAGQQHHLETERLKLERSGGGRTPELLARCEALEKRCAALEEQLHAMQMQLADEQRALDKKLTEILPGGAVIPNTASNTTERTPSNAQQRV